VRKKEAIKHMDKILQIKCRFDINRIAVVLNKSLPLSRREVTKLVELGKVKVIKQNRRNMFAVVKDSSEIKSINNNKIPKYDFTSRVKALINFYKNTTNRQLI